MTRRTLEIAAFCAALLAAALAIHAWLDSRADQQLLQTTLDAQKKILDAADASERARQTALTATLAQIENLKRTTQTPEQILRDLPKYLALPQPITLVRPENSAAANPGQGTAASANSLSANPLAPPQESFAGAASNVPGASRSAGVPPANLPLTNRRPDAPVGPCASPAGCAAQIPSADLKPLYDYVQDCRECQAQLAAAKQNSADDATKIAALTRERDAAITAAKGGAFWRRLRRNALWFAVGAAGGYVAAKR